MEGSRSGYGSGGAAFAGARVGAGLDAAAMVAMVNNIFFHLKKTILILPFSLSLSLSEADSERSGSGCGSGSGRSAFAGPQVEAGLDAAAGMVNNIFFNNIFFI